MALGRKGASLGLLNSGSSLLVRLDLPYMLRDLRRDPHIPFPGAQGLLVKSAAGSSLGPQIKVCGEHRGNLGEGKALPIPASCPSSTSSNSLKLSIVGNDPSNYHQGVRVVD